MSIKFPQFAVPIFCGGLALLGGSCSSTKEVSSLEASSSEAIGAEAVAPKEVEKGLLATKLDEEAHEVLPDGWDFNYVFDAYKGQSNWRQKSGWARNWTRKMDMTGVAWNSVKSGTLVTPRHLVMSNRVPHAVGDEVVFHDAKGNPHVRKVEAVAHLGGMNIDLGMALLDEDVPVTTYKVLPPSRDYPRVLPESPVFVTDAEGKLLVATVLEQRQGHIVYRENTEVRKDFSEKLRQEDIGNPTFICFDGEPILVSVNSLGGYGGGVFLSDPVVYGGLESMIDALGGDHKLESLDIDALDGEVAYAEPSGPTMKAPKPSSGVSLGGFKLVSAPRGASAQPAPASKRTSAHSHEGHTHSHGDHSH